MNTIDALAILAEDIRNVSRAEYRQARRMAKEELAQIDIDALYDCGCSAEVDKIEAVRKAFLPRPAVGQRNAREQLELRSQSTFALFGGYDERPNRAEFLGLLAGWVLMDAVTEALKRS